MIDHSEKARNYFMEGYNCSQSVLMAFCDETGLDEKEAARMAAAFGGGMGRLREVCGAASGMFMVLSQLYGYDDPKAREEKKALYERVQKLAHEFEAENGSLICRELLHLDVKSQDPTPDARTPEYYKKRPCAEMVASAAAILEKYLKEQL